MAIDLGLGDEYVMTYFLLAVISSFISALCSATVVLVATTLKRSMKYQGHINMIIVMSVLQFFYDITFFSAVFYFGSGPYNDFSDSAQQLFGCASTIYTNYIALVTFTSLVKRSFVSVTGYFYPMLIISLIPGIIFATVYQFSSLQSNSGFGYVCFRLASITLNFVLCGLSGLIIICKTRTTPNERALCTLALRLMYYPIVQILSRAVISWYEFKRGFSYDYRHCSPEVCPALLVAIAFNPCASYGYLAIFLIMQPRAARILMYYINSYICCGLFNVYLYPRQQVVSSSPITSSYISSLSPHSVTSPTSAMETVSEAALRDSTFPSSPSPSLSHPHSPTPSFTAGSTTKAVLTTVEGVGSSRLVDGDAMDDDSLILICSRHYDADGDSGDRDSVGSPMSHTFAFLFDSRSSNASSKGGRKSGEGPQVKGNTNKMRSADDAMSGNSGL